MAPASSRSASISSASTTSSSKMSEGVKKKFGCTFLNCGKSFSRSEHLHRHALNHKDGNNTCLRCSAHFRRRDLLDRHMARHKEKDDEAGGPGLGLLATRKRLWRDADGKIVNSRRPSYTSEAGGAKRRQLTRLERKSNSSSNSGTSDEIKPMIFSSSSPMSRTTSTASSTIVVDTRNINPKIEIEETQDSWLALPSPPLSNSHSSSSSTSPSSPQSPIFEEQELGELETSLSEFDTLYEDTFPSHLPPTQPQMRTSYPPPSTQPFQTFMGAMAELPYDDIFKPSAGMYDWPSWNSQVLMSQSRCREEKFEIAAPLLRGQEETGGFRRGFGLELGSGTLC